MARASSIEHSSPAPLSGLLEIECCVFFDVHV